MPAFCISSPKQLGHSIPSRPIASIRPNGAGWNRPKYALQLDLAVLESSRCVVGRPPLSIKSGWIGRLVREAIYVY